MALCEILQLHTNIFLLHCFFRQQEALVPPFPSEFLLDTLVAALDLDVGFYEARWAP